jgi:hypothetical protein
VSVPQGRAVSVPTPVSIQTLSELKGLSLDGIGKLENNSSSHEVEMFRQSSNKRTGAGGASDPWSSQKLSEGLHHDQIIQSYDILFP